MKKLSAFNPLLICLIVSGCSSFPQRPNGYVYNLDTHSNVGYQMSVPRKSSEDFKYTGKDIPVKEMDKYFCVSPEYLLKLQFWADDVTEYAKDKCQ